MTLELVLLWLLCGVVIGGGLLVIAGPVLARIFFGRISGGRK